MSVPGSVVEHLARVADAHPEVCAAYLFGSLARGDATMDSDGGVGPTDAGRDPKPAPRRSGDIEDVIEAVLAWMAAHPDRFATGE